VDVPAL
jgi:hypothetical protein